jgi:hypothetical protein
VDTCAWHAGDMLTSEHAEPSACALRWLLQCMVASAAACMCADRGVAAGAPAQLPAEEPLEAIPQFAGDKGEGNAGPLVGNAGPLDAHGGSTSSESRASSLSSHGERTLLATSLAHLATRVANNYVLWGIAIGFVLSLTKAGPKYLDPGNAPPAAPNKDYIEELGFIDKVLDMLGSCTTPTALFSMGLWIPTQLQAFLTAAEPHAAGASKGVASGPTRAQALQHWIHVRIPHHCAAHSGAAGVPTSVRGGKCAEGAQEVVPKEASAGIV